MEYLKTIIYSLCGAGIVSSIFKLIISNSSVKKTINIFLSMFIFLYTVIPIENMLSNFEVNINNDYETFSYQDIYKDGYESIIIESIQNICKENNVSINLINIESYVDEDGYLVVKEIILELDDKEKNLIIDKEIKKKLNYEVTFV